jgi:hypothetical protein
MNLKDAQNAEKQENNKEETIINNKKYRLSFIT